ncbi:MAG: hypothetical protein Fur0041_09280 [Bacteroidia bacterium]
MKHDTVRMNAYYELGKLYINKKNNDSSLLFFRKGMDLMNTSDTLNVHPKVRHDYLTVYVSLFSSYTSVRKAKLDTTGVYNDFMKALHIAKINNDPLNEGTILNKLGVYFEEKGNIRAAIHFYTESLKIRERFQYLNDLAESYNNLAIVYKNQKEYDLALNYYHKAAAICTQLNDKTYYAKIIGNIGLVYMKQGKFHEAISNMSISGNIRKEKGDLPGYAAARTNLAEMLVQMGKNDTALIILKEALLLQRKFNMSSAIGYNYNITATAYYNKKQYQKSIAAADSALTIFLKLGNPVYLRNTYEILAKNYEATGNKARAFDYYKSFIKFRDSLHNNEIEREAQRNFMQYEYDKKEAKLQQQKKIDEIAYQEDRKRKSIIIYFSIAGLVFFVFFSLVLLKRYRITREQKNIIATQKEIVESKQKEILDSINYARRIQYTLLAHDELLSRNLNDYFILFKPKDIVSGDFYWATSKNIQTENGKTEELFYLAVCDSTGHGVPGAFMSLLNISFLNEAINEKEIFSPEKILNYVRERLIQSISIDGAGDGMDGILMCFNKTSRTVYYAAANNAPIHVSNGTLLDTFADKMPIGMGITSKDFTLHQLQCKKGDMLYLITDGYADQFGGPKGKKFKHKQLTTLLTQLADSSLYNQKTILEQTINEWKGELEQIDDILITGIRIE